MDATEAIVANSSHHTQLLSVIADLEYVPQAKKQQAAYIKDLELQVSELKKNISLLTAKTKKERKEHETLRDSTSRRFAHKLIGKKQEYIAKESKEEREYVEALEREMTERDNAIVTQRLLDDANAVLVDLTDKEMKYESAQAELEALYHRIFDGPTEAFPEDDRLEYELMDAVRRHERFQATLNAESKAAELLARAVKEMELTHRSMQEALGYSRYDMWGGGTMSDMMERNALRNAQANASQAEFLVDQAMRASPAVQPVGRVSIAQGSIVSDVFFDNIFTDIAFHNKIKQSAAQVLLATGRVKAEREAARRRQDQAGAQVLQASKLLLNRRRELDDFRRATFESYAAQHPPPPSYDFVTSPASPPASPSFPTPHVGPSHGSMDLNKPLPVLTQSPQLQPFLPLGMPSPSMPSPSTPSPSMPQPGMWPTEWGSRNPYAFAMAEQTRKLSAE